MLNLVSIFFLFFNFMDSKQGSLTVSIFVGEQLIVKCPIKTLKGNNLLF